MSTVVLRRAAPLILPATLLVAAGALVVSQTSRPAAVLDMWRPWGEIGALAAVMTAIILTGGVDLSVGSIVALAGVVLGMCWQSGWPLPAAAGAAVVVGTLAGAVNGTLVDPGDRAFRGHVGNHGFLCRIGNGTRRRASVWPACPTISRQSARHPGWVCPTSWRCSCWCGWPRSWSYTTRVSVDTLYAMGENPLAAQFAAVPMPLRCCGLCTRETAPLAAIVAVVYSARGGAVVPGAATGIELQRHRLRRAGRHAGDRRVRRAGTHVVGRGRALAVGYRIPVRIGRSGLALERCAVAVQRERPFVARRRAGHCDGRLERMRRRPARSSRSVAGWPTRYTESVVPFSK